MRSHSAKLLETKFARPFVIPFGAASRDGVHAFEHPDRVLFQQLRSALPRSIAAAFQFRLVPFWRDERALSRSIRTTVRPNMAAGAVRI